VPSPRRLRLTDDSVPTTLIFIVLSVFALLTPAQNDTFWHLRSGQYMWESRRLLTSELFSHTAYGTPLPDQWWLSQVAFYGTYLAGGPLLLTVVAGGCAFLAVCLSYRLIRGPLEIRIGLLGFLAIATVAEWAVRPQVISLMLLMASAYFIQRGRIAWLPPLCVIWANAHAMVVLGVAMAVACPLEAAIWSRHFFRRDLVIAIACALAPTVSSLGLHYWPYVLATVNTSRELGLQEYRPSSDATAIPFWIAVAALVILTVRRRGELRTYPREDRILLMAAVILVAAAATAVRNIAFFSVIAAPVLSRLWGAHRRVERVRPAKPVAYGLVAFAAAAAATGVAMKWQNPGALGWQPLSPSVVSAIRTCPDPMFNHFEDGGYLMWVLPEKKVFIDSRVDAYPFDLLRRSREADLFGDYRSLFRDHRIGCAVVRTGSPLDTALRRDNVESLYSDSSRTVFATHQEVVP